MVTVKVNLFITRCKMKKNDFEEFSPRNGRAEGGDRRRGGRSVDVVQQAGGREGILDFTHDVAGGIHDNSSLVLDHSRCRVILVLVYLTAQHRCTVCECLALVCDLLQRRINILTLVLISR